MEKLKSKLKKIKLSIYLGENVKKMKVDIKTHCDILDGSGMSTLQKDTNTLADAKVTYGSILKETTAKYEELVGSTDLTLHVHEKEQTVDPNLPKAYEAATEKAMSSSMKKLKHFNGGGRNIHHQVLIISQVVTRSEEEMLDTGATRAVTFCRRVGRVN
eukprot:3713524-Ditylum_brightwellii.AAC.1